jgi:hypothetical protein
MRFVEVHWRDAVAIAKWKAVGEPPEGEMAVTRGWLVVNEPDVICLAATLSDDEYNAAQQIPRGMIVGEIEDFPKVEG